MKFHLITAIISGLFSGILFSLPAWGQDAENRQVDQKEYQALMLASGKQIDPELKKRVAAFEKHFSIKEAAYANHRDHTIQVLKDNPNFTDDEKRIKIRKVQEQYRERSWKLVRKYREPVNERLIELTNAGLSKTERVEAGMGKGLFTEQTIIENGREKKILVRNPDHSGALSDTDTQAGTKGIDRMAKIAEMHGIKVVRDGNTVDMPEIEHTINRHARSPEGDAARDNERFLAGSSEKQAQLYADAHNKERFLFVGIDGNDKSLSGMREAVEKRDHMKKAADGVNLGNQKPELLLEEENRGKLQKFGKSTNKMMSNISDTELKAFMQKNRLSGTPESYRKTLTALHNRKWENVDVDNKNVDAWFKTSRDIQALSLQKADRKAALDMDRNNADLKRLSKQLKNDNLPESEKQQITRQYFRKKSDLMDAQERLKQTQAVLDENITKNGTKPQTVKKPEIFSDIPGKSETRKKLSALADKNYRKIGKGMGYYAKINKTRRVVQLIQQGDVKEMAKYAYEEARDEITDRFKEKLVPGYGNMKMAFDVGWGTGRLIGENVRLGPGGPTVDEVAQQQMFTVYDAISGNRQIKWEQQRESAYKNYFMEQMAEYPGAVPAGMSASQAFALAKEKAMAGGNFFETVDNILDEGDREQREAKSEYLLTKNARLIEDSKRAGLVREALDIGFSPYDLSGKDAAQLQAMINARKAGIARLEAEEKAWQKARSLDTQKSYIEYASKFTDGANFDLARKLANQRFQEILVQAEAKMAAEKKAEEEFNFDEDDNADAVDSFRSKMANIKDRTNKPVTNNTSAETEDVFDQGIAAQKKYDDTVAYIEKTKRETAEIWRKINEDRARRAKEKAASRQFWGDLLSAVGQATREYAEQSTSESSSSYGQEVIDDTNYDSKGKGNPCWPRSCSDVDTEWEAQVYCTYRNKYKNNAIDSLGLPDVRDTQGGFFVHPVSFCGRTYYIKKEDIDEIKLIRDPTETLYTRCIKITIESRYRSIPTRSCSVN